MIFCVQKTDLKEKEPSASCAIMVRLNVDPNISSCSCSQVKRCLNPEFFQFYVTLLKISSINIDLFTEIDVACKKQRIGYDNPPVAWNQGEFLRALVSTCWGGCFPEACSCHLAETQTPNLAAKPETGVVNIKLQKYDSVYIPFLWNSHSRYSCGCFSLETQPP